MALVLHVPQRAGEVEHVHIADDAGNVYQGSLADFALDHGSAFPALPTDSIGREYDPSVRHFTYTAAAELVDGELPWTDGDDLIAAVVAMNTAKETRLTPPEPTYTIDELKTTAHEEVDKFAETTRRKYITKGDGQAMAYIEKGEEAADYVAAGYPADLSSYPFIQAEVNGVGKTATEAADDILAQKSAWIIVGAAVEEVRLGGKKNITAATTEEDVAAAEAATITALEAI